MFIDTQLCSEPQLAICAHLKLEMSAKSHVNCALLYFQFEPKLELVDEFQSKTLTLNFIKLRSTILHRDGRNDGRVAALGSEREQERKEERRKENL